MDMVCQQYLPNQKVKKLTAAKLPFQVFPTEIDSAHHTIQYKILLVTKHSINILMVNKVSGKYPQGNIFSPSATGLQLILVRS